ncbi:hypothetical protein BX616_002660 [Lobosporangium transversale]|uniref:Uncharacterized protein n=1 Tax=Lobosporangium transversale TaxID=64571 RepID=A0A1Y2H246_9FUNG|nr:hypothetical protein BCR41DRAFT_120982 [Lobosporangium transversale]KAF9900187.1 hypothetical protein BX616_002660 [Lobosporangium transversale]ORZ27783.1 hypothetical protein BCR41DRAFT_120982 [Lobosporangium transversale]|eukprot:XP_021885486.1 hypothetical protein BCR41DRAFT_120982 [Lobosporangium transversale]
MATAKLEALMKPPVNSKSIDRTHCTNTTQRLKKRKRSVYEQDLHDEDENGRIQRQSRKGLLRRSYQSQTQNQYQNQCWKALYKLNYNWIMGQARVASVSVQDMFLRDQNVLGMNINSTEHINMDINRSKRYTLQSPPIVQFKGSVILIVSPNNLVHLWRVQSVTDLLSSSSSTSAAQSCSSSTSPLLSSPSTRCGGQPEFWQTYRSSSSNRSERMQTPLQRQEEEEGREEHRADHTLPKITCLSLDSSVKNITSGWQKVMVGFESGHFAIFEYAQQPQQLQEQGQQGQQDSQVTAKIADARKSIAGNLSSTSALSPVDGNIQTNPKTTLREIGNTMDLKSWSEVGRIQTASFLYPVLITCSNDGAISIYLIQSEASSPPPSTERSGGDRSSPHHWCRLLHRLYGTSTESPIGVDLEQIKEVATSTNSDNSPLRRENGDDDKEKGRRTESKQWRALISFGLELHDGSWTVRLQEIEFDEHYILHSMEIGAEGDSYGSMTEIKDGFYDTHNINNGGSTSIIDEEQDEEDLIFPTYFSKSAESTAVGHHARIGPISTISISWPFVVTTHSDNTMNVFQMAREIINPKTTTMTTTSTFGSYGTPWLNITSDTRTRLEKRLRFQHLSTLYGHCGAVSSVSIESRSGRLVSASMDRSIKVWTMAMKNHEDDRLEHQRVHQCAVSMSDINKSWTESGQVTKEEGLGLIWVGSDEEKIVSMNCDGTVKIWQFS